MKSKFHLITLSLFYLLFSTATLPVSAEDELDPVADPAAVVTSGNVRFTVLTSQMIRIQYSATAQFEDRATFAIVNRRLPVPEFTTETSDGYLYIHTNDLTLRYKEGSIFSQTDKMTNYRVGQTKKKRMPIHVGIVQKTIHRVLGKRLTKPAHLDLIVHAHWAEHQIEDVEHDHHYGNAFLLVGSAIPKKLYHIKPTHKPCCSVRASFQIFASCLLAFLG